jgi:putative intracellular protease/amidase
MATDKAIVNAFKQRIDVYADSDELVELLLPIDEYAAQEAAVHIAGLWELALEMMAYIED